MKYELMIFQCTLHLGQAFGDLALRVDKNNPDKVVRRAASITTTKDSIFAIIGKHDYRAVLEKIERKSHEAMINFFK
jgi:hypothetical protein